ncbi:WD40 repeat domain-containing protein [Streptomyces virginiae]|uniref:WD40 repeat domain-containing protein n=1 Tax=Streptomyces virginiae TaxID=1961 RepID=UPI0033197FD3
MAPFPCETGRVAHRAAGASGDASCSQNRQPGLRGGVSPDGRFLATADRTGGVRLWDPATRQPVGEPLTGHTKEVFAVVFSPDGTVLATASTDGTVQMWVALGTG